MIALVKKQMLNDRQRREIQEYLVRRPNKMPAYVRGLRMTAKALDFEEMRKDLTLLEELSFLDIQIGRKSNDYKEIHAKMNIRQRASVDAKATLRVRQRQ